MRTSGTEPERHLRVLLADESEDALTELCRVVEGLGHDVMPYAVSVHEAAELIAREDPDLACVMVHQDDDHALALISEVVEFHTGPVIAVLREADVEFVARAAEHGISAYIPDLTPSPEVVQGAIEVALRRYRENEDLSAKVTQLQTALDRRTTIERAKGILMERHRIDDREAFALLRDHARAQQRRVIEVAESVTEGHALL